MTTLRATVRDGRLELNVPADWPNGIAVEIHPLTQRSDAAEMSPEEISATPAAMDHVEPFELTEAEHAAGERDTRAARHAEKTQFGNEAERLRGMWE